MDRTMDLHHSFYAYPIYHLERLFPLALVFPAKGKYTPCVRVLVVCSQKILRQPIDIIRE